jgi:hypothetical protein
MMRQKLIFPIIFLLLVSVVLGGCARQSQQVNQSNSDDIDMTLVVAPDPPVVGESDLLITLREKDGLPIDGASLEIKGDMSHAGMKPVLANISEGESGVYAVPFEWTMGGDWFVAVTATLPDGRVATKRFDLSVGAGMDMDNDMEHSDSSMDMDDMERSELDMDTDSH